MGELCGQCERWTMCPACKLCHPCNFERIAELEKALDAIKLHMEMIGGASMSRKSGEWVIANKALEGNTDGVE